MSDNKQVHVSGGMGFFSMLTIVFIVLKLCDVVNWSWWLVLAPLWIPWSIFLIIIFCMLVAFAISEVAK